LSADSSTRMDWVIAQLALAAHARVLEFGCGSGALAARLCDSYPELSMLAVDRSAPAVQRAATRLRRHLDSGILTLRQVALADLEASDQSFDVAFGVNVNVFWTSPATAELAVLRRALVPGGRLLICFGPAPVEDRQAGILATVADHLRAEGFDHVAVTADPAGSAVTARSPG
jgi:cyclopropane fatty-acyl-phospholipid synthase-like methyltransferase